jgi:hypothetical protein
MATTTKKNPFSETTERLETMNTDALEGVKQLTVAYCDSYEKLARGVAESVQQVGKATNVEWIAAVTGAQANLVREVSAAYADSTRKLVG